MVIQRDLYDKNVLVTFRIDYLKSAGVVRRVVYRISGADIATAVSWRSYKQLQGVLLTSQLCNLDNSVQ